MKVYKLILKRFFDISICLIAIVVLAPLFLSLIFLVRYNIGYPVFFSQRRSGKNGRPFTLYKFRTMTNSKDVNGHLLPNEQRQTRFGSILRSTSLDELPEMWNVLRGDMSLVGPRPLLIEYLPYYDEKQRKRHNVLPGITGWAQVNGRNAIGWEERFALDVWYVNHQSLLLDLKIIFKTIWKVFKRENIEYRRNTFMPRFDDYMKNKHH